MGWQIFVHSVRQVFGNLGGALRVSALLTIVQLGVTYFFGKALLADEQTIQMMIRTGTFPWGAIAFSMIVSTVAGLWIAVGWHRYVLLNEGAGVVPPLRVDRMLGYFGKTILISLLLMLLAIPLFIIAGLIGGAMMNNNPSRTSVFVIMGVMAVLVYLPLLVVGLRLTSVLPGVALEAGVPLFHGWEATKGQSGAVFVPAVILIVADLGFEYVLGLVFANPVSLPAIVARGVCQWLLGMVGISVLTTLYGHFVERRPLRV